MSVDVSDIACPTYCYLHVKNRLQNKGFLKVIQLELIALMLLVYYLFIPKLAEQKNSETPGS
jgi:hypothetical protein